jgi:hypothetical protein
MLRKRALVSTFVHLAGQFFLESATILYDDLARRAECDGADPALMDRQVSAAWRLVDLIDCHGDQHWDQQRKRLLMGLKR